MEFDFEYIPIDSPYIDSIWRTHSTGGSFVASATCNLGLVITKQKDGITVGVRGPESKATPSPVPDDAEIFGVAFKVGTYMPHLPTSKLVDVGITLPAATGQRFWLHSETWQLPDFEHADVFVEILVRQGLLTRDPVVEATLLGELRDLSERSVQRRFRHATGLTPGAHLQIARAQQAMTLLQQGVSILDTVEQAGYYDQPHLTRALKRFMGYTPAEILRRDGSVDGPVNGAA